MSVDVKIEKNLNGQKNILMRFTVTGNGVVNEFRVVYDHQHDNNYNNWIELCDAIMNGTESGVGTWLSGNSNTETIECTKDKVVILFDTGREGPKQPRLIIPREYCIQSFQQIKATMMTMTK